MAKPAKLRRGSLRRRSPRLSQERIDAICEIIRDWQGRLTWDDLCQAYEQKTGFLYTRAALNNHIPIKAAYERYCKEPTPVERDKELSASKRRVLKLKAKVAELETIRDTLLERLSRWAVNAAERGLDEDFLNRPLDLIDRSENYCLWQMGQHRSHSS